MTISALAKAAGGLTLRTIRFYEEKGLLAPAATTSGGQKRYGPDTLRLLQRVLLLQEAGLSLDQIGTALGALARKTTKNKSCQQAHALVLVSARQALQRRLHDLAELTNTLDAALANKLGCEACSRGDCAGCPVLDTWARFGFAEASTSVNHEATL